MMVFIACDAALDGSRTAKVGDDAIQRRDNDAVYLSRTREGRVDKADNGTHTSAPVLREDVGLITRLPDEISLVASAARK